MRKIKVMVVDDSAFMRKAITSMLESDPEIKVVGTAGTGEECLEKYRELNPDIIALDLDMPGMGGIETLKRIMREHPVPVVVISALTYEGAQITFEAFEAGAADVIYKDILRSPLDVLKKEKEIIEKVKAIARKGVVKVSGEPKVIKREFKVEGEKGVAIGASTGGPSAIETILRSLPGDFPSPIFVTQHMPDAFIKLFAERLNKLSQLNVVKAEDGMRAEPSHVYIAPGNSHLTVKRVLKDVVIQLSKTPNTLYRPSVDVMMESVGEVFRSNSVGIILTGMGNDGVRGAKAIKEKGGIIIAQDEKTSVVFGMPRAVIEENLADKILPLEKIPEAIIDAL